jgi:hypothetical protein
VLESAAKEHAEHTIWDAVWSRLARHREKLSTLHSLGIAVALRGMLHHGIARPTLLDGIGRELCMCLHAMHILPVYDTHETTRVASVFRVVLLQS